MIGIGFVASVAACQSAEAKTNATTVESTISWTSVPVIGVQTATAVPIESAQAQIPTQVPSQVAMLDTADSTDDVTSGMIAEVITVTPTVGLSTDNSASIPSLVPSPSLAITRTVLPTNTRRPSATSIYPTAVKTVISTNPPGAFNGDNQTWTPLPPVRTIKDHYLFQRPFSDPYVNYWARNYSYGSTEGGQRPIHHGIDWMNPTGTPIQAIGNGTVYYAGPDITTLYGPQSNFYGNVIVIQHPITDANGQPVYSLYGHLSQIEVKTGQAVKAGQEIGLVGSAGVAIGPHLHLEIRVGNPTDYNSTRNPELWVIPFKGNGGIAGRVMDMGGNLQPGVTVEVRSDAVYNAAYSYADNTTPGDSVLGENFVIPDISAGYYTIYIRSKTGSLRFKNLIYVSPGRTSWVDINVAPEPTVDPYYSSQ